MAGAKHFLNLTNGLEAAPVLEGLGIRDYGLIRVQSTLCEAGAMEKVLCELDSSFFLALALGWDVYVYDYGSRNKKRGVSRACWYGLEFVRYALDTIWFGQAARKPLLRGYGVQKMFDEHIFNFAQTTDRRVRYYRKYLPPDLTAVRLHCMCAATEYDTDDEFYVGLSREHCAPPPPLPLPTDGEARHVEVQVRSQDWLLERLTEAGMEEFVPLNNQEWRAKYGKTKQEV